MVRSPIIKDLHDVYSIKKPSKENGVYKKIFNTLDYFQKETEFKIPVGATDPQGPLDVASLIMDNSSFLFLQWLHLQYSDAITHDHQLFVSTFHGRGNHL